MDAIKTYAMPILRYGFGILKWSQQELRKMDTKTRNILTKFGFHHPKSCTQRLYVSRKFSGRGLISVVDCYRQENTAMAKYLVANKLNDPLVDIVRRVEAAKCYGIMAYSHSPRRGNAKDINIERYDLMLKKKLHGDYQSKQHNNINVDPTLSYDWIRTSHLRPETESLICAAQEQTLATKYVRTKIWKTSSDANCRLCKESPETIHHIVSGCKMLAGTQYTYRHNQVATYLHWCVLRDIGVSVPETWTQHTPAPTVSTNEITVLWDLPIITDKKVKANRPDITIHDRKNRECIFVDVSIPVCENIVKKEAEKLTKYRDLEIETQKCWNLKKVRTIPIVVGALGAVCKNLPKYIKAVTPRAKFCTIQKTALLGTAHIIRNFLTPIND